MSVEGVLMCVYNLCVFDNNLYAISILYVLIICLSGWFQEQDEWFQREQELLQRIDEVSEKHTKILQNERVSITCIRQYLHRTNPP